MMLMEGVGKGLVERRESRTRVSEWGKDCEEPVGNSTNPLEIGKGIVQS